MILVRRVYLDNAATSPPHPEAVKTMNFFLLERFGNPSSLHAFGREAREGVESTRRTVAALISAEPEEVFFTSGGTEANNLAITGVARANRSRGNHIITSQVEHHAVLHTCEALEKEGFAVTRVQVDRYGVVDPDDVRRAITPGTTLVTIMLANNEIGTVEPIREIAAVAREAGVYMHTDAVQAAGNTPVSARELGVDLMTISGHKFYGPKGVGALFVRKGTKISPIIHGGGHERGMRAGTENAPAIAGLGKAAELAAAEMGDRVLRITRLREKLLRGVLERVEAVHLNGHPERRLPNNVNVSVEGVEGEAIVLGLDMRGIAASSGSACTSASLEPSHVLLATGQSPELAHGSLRMTLGRLTTDEDIDYVLEALVAVISRLRAISPFAVGGRAAT